MRLLIVDDEDDFTVSLARGLREQMWRQMAR